MPEPGEPQPIHPVHDRFVKDFLHEPAEAAAVFQIALPALAKELRWAELRQEPCEFIDEMLGQQSSDLLFSLPFGDRRLRLFLLFEHLSNPERNLPFRLHQYKGASWEQQVKKGEKPGPIICVVLYHGKDRWNPPRNMSEWLKLTTEEEDQVGRFTRGDEYAFLDLSRIAIESLEIRAYSKMVLSLLKSMAEAKELEWLDQHASFLEELLREPDRQARVRTLIRYCLQASARLDYRSFQRKLNAIRYDQVKKTVMSIEDMLIERGEQLGELIGRVETLEKFLKMNPTPKNELRQIPIDELEKRVQQLEAQCFR
jgi:predicted transposase/invertase (TIGR01784 family)